MDERGQFVTPLITFPTRPDDLDRLLSRAHEGAVDNALQITMEPTGMAWFPVAAYLAQQPNITIYLVNAQQVADLRRFYTRHAKSDRIDARVLARLPLVNPERLHRLKLPAAAAFACQRGAKQLDQLQSGITAIKNRLRAIDRFAWPGIDQHVFSDLFSPAARWFREHWYDPALVVESGAALLRQQWRDSAIDANDSGQWAAALTALATQVLALYGQETAYLDYELLQAEVCREQQHLEFLEHAHHQLRLKTVRPLYRAIHPSRNLETIKGVGHAKGAEPPSTPVSSAIQAVSPRHAASAAGTG